ncbi:MAG TPA: hypothetical protein PKJ65_01895 [Clostridia bacterium]|jgi:hypothetical protein|nr:MAG: hypothetical protein BWX78_00792 [Firmicutes bacterium ADurb.Bin099]HNZ40624.1 hypothetical protein [Clostridia bacterium]HPY98115.1 hypothetical protein [Clostridia bacterium]HQC68056.1 hypothetical protein [Clostridia bacterium]
MRQDKKTAIAIITVAFIMSLMFCTTAQTADLVIASVEYVDAKIAEVRALIQSSGTPSGGTTPVTPVDNAKITELETALGNALKEMDALRSRMDFLDVTVRDMSDNYGMQVLHVYKDDVIYALGTSELILRSGSAIVIGNANNEGLSDATTGENLNPGVSLGKDHFVVIPRGDGRGIKITSGESFIMYRGSFSYVPAN